MDPSFFVKKSLEKRYLEFDVSPALAVGDSLASITSVNIYNSDGTDVTSDITEGTPSIVGDKFYVWIKDGIEEERYKVNFWILTTNGEKIPDELKVKILPALHSS